MRFLLAFLLTAPVWAQGSSFEQDIGKHWAISKAFTLKIAEQMPEEAYTFKPTPEQMSFAEQQVIIEPDHNPAGIG